MFEFIAHRNVDPVADLFNESRRATATRDGEPVARYYVDTLHGPNWAVGGQRGARWYAIVVSPRATDDDLRGLTQRMAADPDHPGRGSSPGIVESWPGFLGWHDDERAALAACRAHAEGLGS